MKAENFKGSVRVIGQVLGVVMGGNFTTPHEQMLKEHPSLVLVYPSVSFVI